MEGGGLGRRKGCLEVVGARRPVSWAAGRLGVSATPPPMLGSGFTFLQRSLNCWVSGGDNNSNANKNNVAVGSDQKSGAGVQDVDKVEVLVSVGGV